MTAAVALGHTPAERTAMRNEYIAAGYTLFAPTAANALVSGRVTDSLGRGLPNVRVSLSNGADSRSVTTNSFGYFSFADVTSGQTYVVNVQSRRYQFSDGTRVISVSDNVSGVDFIAGVE
jgi:hypothetical protein